VDNSYVVHAPVNGEMSAESKYTSIKIAPEVRDRIRSLKRGQQSYTELLDAMADAYDPEQHFELDTRHNVSND
jgi:hypothetical protein